MKIDEVIRLYEFLGNLDLVAFGAVCALLNVAIIALLLPLKDKLMPAPGKASGMLSVPAIVITVTAPLTILYYKAKDRAELIQLGNYVKQDIMATNYKQKSFRNIDLSKLGMDSTKKARMLKEMIVQLPKDFVHVTLSGAKGEGEDGVCLVNPADIEIINKSINDRAVATSKLLSDYMKANHLTQISAAPGEKLSKIDNYGWLIGKPFFDALTGKNGLYAVYDTAGNWGITGFRQL